MFEHLQIYDRRARALVGIADLALKGAAPLLRGRRRAAIDKPQRILLLRLERIGDLLMSLDAIGAVRQAAPEAHIDLVVGSWNRELARRIPGISQVDTLDAAWLARETTGQSLGAMLQEARSWRARRYDLGINFEPDIRSNLLLAASGARRTAGFSSGGGGALLDVSLEYDPASHTSDNGLRLVRTVLDGPPLTTSHLKVEPPERASAAALLGARRGRGPLVGIHVSGGRAIKQWPPERFAEVARRVSQSEGATIVLTGSPADRPLVERVAAALPGGDVVDLAGAVDLPTLAAVLSQLDLLVTGDTGPMHVAAAVGTPVVAVFGPSDPVRYAPRDPMHRIVRVDLPCSPCNRIRLPPERCAGHTPDCLAGITVESVYDAVVSTLQHARDRQRAAARG